MKEESGVMSPYRIEVSPPKQSVSDLTGRLERFALRYRMVVEAGHCACVTDNAMGRLAFQGPELLRELSLPVCSGRVMVHVNTFHSLADLHWLLDLCVDLGVRDLLAVSGDGSVRLPKLKPSEIGGRGESATSADLLAYIRRKYDPFFRVGVAFNQYEPEEEEFGKLAKKLDAGASFVITQPVIGRNPVIERLRANLPVPLIIEAWMSRKIELLTDCIGYDPGFRDVFEPVDELRRIRETYPDCGAYLALLDFKTQFQELPGWPDPRSGGE
jgi:methylenetetrahydrofolate reductase (NADPH)